MRCWIGIAGGQDKCDWVKTLGADACVDYRSATFEDDLKKATEGGVSVFFDKFANFFCSLSLPPRPV